MHEPIIIKSTEFPDQRGKLEKLLWNDCEWRSLIDPIIEVFITKSKKGCVRGLHFQNPPHAVNKVIKVINGTILEVVIDLRVGSPRFGKLKTLELKASSHQSDSGIFIPKGFAHGYQALTDDTEVLYFMDGEYNQECDSGINTDSFDISWPITEIVKSTRDETLLELSDFESPFTYD
jgi:dTDP-4-dehydrorhamnose 3,5-epimerase